MEFSCCARVKNNGMFARESAVAFSAEFLDPDARRLVQKLQLLRRTTLVMAFYVTKTSWGVPEMELYEAISKVQEVPAFVPPGERNS